MKNFIRKILRDTSFYVFAAHFYHSYGNFLMRILFLFRQARYLNPRKPSGDYKSQYGQDYFLEKFGLVKKNGFFLEIGCNHPIHNSNTYYLEKILGWQGVSIDGIDYSKLYAEYRPKTQFLHTLIDENVGEVDFYQVRDVDGWENQLSSVYEATLSMSKGFTAEVKKVRTVPLRQIEGIPLVIDLMLIDVEGHEFSVLNSLDWKIHIPTVIVIENAGEFYERKDMEFYMKEKGYKLFARIGISDDIYILN